MRVDIDRARCTGHGRCYALAPEVYTDDDDGYGQVIGDGTVPDELVSASESGANSCPEQAISVTVSAAGPA